MKNKLFIISLILSLTLYMFISRLGILNDYSQTELELINPLLEELNKEEKVSKLDLQFYKTVKKTTIYNINNIPIINNNYSPYEVLVVGDSTVLMGLSPNIVKQTSHMNVGFFTFPAMKLNVELLYFIGKFRDRYMTSNHIILFAFDPNFIFVKADSEQDNKDLEVLIRYPEKKLNSYKCLFCNSTDKNYKNMLEKKIKQLFSYFYFDPPAIRFYHFFIEEYISYKSYKQNQVDTEHSNRGQRYRVKDGSMFIHKLNPNIIRKTDPPNLIQINDKETSWMKQAMIELKLEPIFWVPLTSDISIRRKLLSTYQQVFSDYTVIDANSLLDEGDIVEAQNRTHLANLGAIKQSQLLGSWLKQHRVKSTKKK